eukprot:1150583-Pleurochrysis_carterae.AAC.1
MRQARHSGSRRRARSSQCRRSTSTQRTAHAPAHAARVIVPIRGAKPVSYTHLRAHETDSYL